MLKAKNIVIIFILNYLLILLACSFLEIIFISNHAQTAQLLMRTAADMALEQVQATDDFFVTGGGYLLENQGSYKLNVCTGTRFEQVDLFPSFTGLTNSVSDIGNIYTKLYGGGKMKKFIEDSSILNLRFITGYTQPPLGIDSDTNILVTNWYHVPKIYQMGKDILGVDDGSILNNFLSLGIPIYNSGSKQADVDAIMSMYELNNATKKAYDSLGNEINYYYTPISLGITYINEDLLQALFINNIDLLMRSKYTQNSSYDLSSAECGNGIWCGSFYKELVDTDSLSAWNPINNGAFTFLRGTQVSGTSQGAMFFEGTVKPKIEYIVLDMYNNSDLNNEMLQQVLGPRFTNSSDSDVDARYKGQTLTGGLLKDIDKESIEYLETIIYGAPNSSSPLNHKPIVIAKVTFYADFIIPYSTVSLREMRGREQDDIINGRLLFDAFSNAPTDGTFYLDNNYVDLEIRTLLSDGSVNPDWEKLYPSEYYDDIGLEVKRLGGNYHSDALMYTTYFAITP